jgi:hypothetical protein
MDDDDLTDKERLVVYVLLGGLVILLGCLLLL